MPKLLFVVAEVSYFKSHRLSLALYAKEQGYEVALASQCKRNFRKDKLYLESLGIQIFHIPFDRTGLNPIKDLMVLAKLRSLYKSYQPDIVHHVALKPILYGTIAARLVKFPKIVNAISGFGVIFAKTSLLLSILKYPIKKMLTWAFSKSHVIVQNHHDKKIIDSWTGGEAKTHLILGAGVNVNDYMPATTLHHKPIITFVGRLLWSKGLRELAHAAKILRAHNVDVTIQVVGDPDQQNPDHVPDSWIKRKDKKKLLTFLGHQEDIKGIYQNSRIAVLPSYREGLPKSLIEACACGLPIVTTDTPGCREVVEYGVNGFLVPPKDPKSLADRLMHLLADPKLCEAFGKASRKKAEELFADRHIHQAHLKVWQD